MSFPSHSKVHYDSFRELVKENREKRCGILRIGCNSGWGAGFNVTDMV